MTITKYKGADGINRTITQVLDGLAALTDYASLRSYTGTSSTVRLETLGVAGSFKYDPTDSTSADNGGTLIVDSSARRWKRMYEGRAQAYWFLSAAQYADVVGQTFALDVTAPMQTFLSFLFLNSIKGHFGRGGYKVTGLSIISTDPEDDKRILDITGDGFGNPFAAWSYSTGTTIRSTTNAPILNLTVPTPTETAGVFKCSGIVFDGTSNSYPVLFMGSFYGTGEITQCCVFQRGTGSGLVIQGFITSEVSDCYILNDGWYHFSLGAARTGVGIYLDQRHDAGLQTIRKCTSRGWHTPYKIGAGGLGAYTYNASVRDCECSLSYNGIHLTDNARNTVVDNCYFEGGEGGRGIWDQGNYNKVTNNFTFAGYGIHLDSETATRGSVYTGNTFSAGGIAEQTLVKILSSSAGGEGGDGKVLSGNHMSFGGSGGSLTNVLGLHIIGTDPRLDYSGNTFDPRGAWVGGAGTAKVYDVSSGVIGLGTAFAGAYEFPMLSRGAISLGQGSTLGTANITSGHLTMPNGSYFNVTSASAVTVNRITTGGTTGMIVVLQTTNANTTFTNSAYIQVAGGVSFVGPGNIGFMLVRQGGADFAVELFRTKF